MKAVIDRFAAPHDALLQKVLVTLFVISLLLLGAFNDFALINPASAMFRSPSLAFFYAALVVFAGYFFCFGVERRPHRFALQHQLLLLFVIWALLSFVVNLTSIANLVAEREIGVRAAFNSIRFVTLMASGCLLFGYIFAGRDEFLNIAGKALIWSFVITLPYVVVEFATYFLNNDAARISLGVLDTYLHSRRDEEYIEVFRLRGLAFEPSFFGAYLCIVFPWLLAAARGGEIRYKALAIVALIVVVLTRSRTAYVAVTVELILFYWLARKISPAPKRRSMYTRLISTGTLVVFVAGVVAFSLQEAYPGENYAELLLNTLTSITDESVGSNVTRIGSQHAAFLVAFDNPVFGVGLGLSGAHLEHYYPQYIYASDEIQTWIRSGHEDFSAPAFGLFAGIAADLGLVGLAIFISLWVCCMKKTYRKVKQRWVNRHLSDFNGAALFVSIAGTLIASFGLNSFLFTGYWVLLVLAFVYLQDDDTATVTAPPVTLNEMSSRVI